MLISIDFCYEKRDQVEVEGTKYTVHGTCSVLRDYVLLQSATSTGYRVHVRFVRATCYVLPGYTTC